MVKDMSKIVPNKPFLLMLYGFPGSGKTYFARQFVDKVQAAHLQADRIRHELFQQPRYDREENAVVSQIMDYMTGEFLQAGVSVVYDTNLFRTTQRRTLRDKARAAGAEPVLIWQQIDADGAASRVMRRDRRKADDKFALQPDRQMFTQMTQAMQSPAAGEEYVVTSGKHVFPTQYSTLMRYLSSRGVVSGGSNMAVVKPGLVNLVPPSHIARPDALGNSNRRINIV